MIKKLPKSGFTLIELLLFMGIFSMLLVMITQIFVSTLDAQKDSESLSAVYQDGTYILSRITYDVSRSSAIAIPASLGQQTNSLQLTINSQTYTYSLNNNNLVITDDAGTDVLNGYDTTVSNLSFTRLGNTDGKNSIRLAFTATSKIQRPQGPEQLNFQTTVGTR